MLTHKELVFLSIAHTLAELSTCPRKAVGALIVRDGRCVSWGYNGAPPGLPHCEENDHGWQTTTMTERTILMEQLGLMYDGKNLEKIASDRFGCRNTTHAEANALAFAAREGISTDGGTLFTTVSPCSTCSRLLIAAGIVRVIADEPYRDQQPLEMLRDGGVAVWVEKL